MTTLALRQQLTADANHAIHIVIPPEMGNDVEEFVFPRTAIKKELPPDSLVMARMLNESGFAQNVLNNPEEDCWNEL